MLPRETDAVWKSLQNQPALAGFVLIGGSALALRIGHRISEDLDLVFPASQLPRARIEVLCRIETTQNLRFERNDDEAAVFEFAQGGLDLHDYQQNFLVNAKVKVSFFAPTDSVIKVLTEPAGATVRVATLAELFKTKALTSAVRSKTRDWLDLYLLMRDHNFSMHDYRSAFVQAGIENQCDTGLARLCSGVPQTNDEGYQHLLRDAPVLEEMTAFFRRERDNLEIQLAAERHARGSGKST